MSCKFDDIHEKIESGVYKLATNRKSTRSTVWQVYRKIEKDDGTILEEVLYCMGCKNIMSFVHKSTTNLRRHKCHLQYLKKQEIISLDTSEQSKMDEDGGNTTEEDRQSLSDDIEIKPTAVDVAAYVAGILPPVDSPILPSHTQPVNRLQQRQLSDVPEISLTHPSDGGIEESNIYAQTWSLEFRKLSDDQKFYAKRAIDEIFVLGRLRRLTLNTVTPAE
ncbi:uncharacterized protein [Drosophila bipectinata]|uniref:uncharacterized protein n=1 Tax=Drosophila bipectinata TaxID=42026 RepID=UPI001C8913E8|nr:uncharacterized protein LOC108120423 [Drosophila bipectinata]